MFSLWRVSISRNLFLLCRKVFWLTEEWASVAALRFSTFLYNWTKNQRTRNFALFLANFGYSVTNLLTFCCSWTKLKLICALRPFLGKVIGAMALIPKFNPCYPISHKNMGALVLIPKLKPFYPICHKIVGALVLIPKLKLIRTLRIILGSTVTLLRTKKAEPGRTSYRNW